MTTLGEYPPAEAGETADRSDPTRRRVVLIALVAIAVWNWKKARITRSTATEMAAVYWHFMDGLWIFLFLLLKLGQ